MKEISMSLVSFFSRQLGIFSLKIGKNLRFLALGTVPFIGPSYISEKKAVILILNKNVSETVLGAKCRFTFSVEAKPVRSK